MTCWVYCPHISCWKYCSIAEPKALSVLRQYECVSKSTHFPSFRAKHFSTNWAWGRTGFSPGAHRERPRKVSHKTWKHGTLHTFLPSYAVSKAVETRHSVWTLWQWESFQGMNEGFGNANSLLMTYEFLLSYWCLIGSDFSFKGLFHPNYKDTFSQLISNLIWAVLMGLLSILRYQSFNLHQLIW